MVSVLHLPFMEGFMPPTKNDLFVSRQPGKRKGRLILCE